MAAANINIDVVFLEKAERFDKAQVFPVQSLASQVNANQAPGSS
jgi:hypothetical protein